MNILNKVKYRFMNNRIAREIERQHDIKNDLLKEYQYIIDKFEHKDYKKEFSKKIFICWFQGLENAPLLVQKCVESVKKAFPKKEIIILTDDNYKEYTNFPDYIIQKYESGIISKAHFSDLLRINLLINHGGLWIDSTVFCTATTEPEYITKQPLFVYKEINLNRTDNIPVKSSSWLINSCKNNPILMGTQEILFEYWKKENTLSNYFLFHLAFSIVCDEYKEEFDKIPVYNNINPHILQFELEQPYDENRFNQITKISDFHKLRRIEVNDDVYTNYDFVIGEGENGKN